MPKIEFRNNKHALGGRRDVDIEGIDDKTYDVFTAEDKLEEARKAYPTYDWFASFTIKDKSGKDVERLPPYTIKFDKPESGTLYYYYKGTAYPVPYEDTENKGNKKRVKATLTVGDPPIGTG
ncbi:MAG TPA: hypothetical protein VNK49_00265 [Anaerolineales bacterium]|nr:hypothetical protein [Anaerolineales bacterium]